MHLCKPNLISTIDSMVPTLISIVDYTWHMDSDDLSLLISPSTLFLLSVSFIYQFASRCPNTSCPLTSMTHEWDRCALAHQAHRPQTCLHPKSISTLVGNHWHHRHITISSLPCHYHLMTMSLPNHCHVATSPLRDHCHIWSLLGGRLSNWFFDQPLCGFISTTFRCGMILKTPHVYHSLVIPHRDN